MVRKSQSARECRRLEARVLRGIAIARARSLREREEQLAPQLVVGGGDEVERLEGDSVEPCSLVVCEHYPRSIRSTRRERERRVGVGGGQRMLCDLPEVRPEVGGVDFLQRTYNLPVQPDPACRRQLLVERVPHQYVCEAKRGRRAGNVPNHARRRRVLEDIEYLVLVAAAELREHRDLELAAEDGRDREQLLRRVREVPKSPRHDRLHRLRNRFKVQWMRIARILFERDQAQYLRDEQRVAVGAIAERRHESIRRDARLGAVDVLADVACAEASQGDLRCRRLAEEVSEEGAELVCGNRVDVSVGRDDEDARRRELAHDELEQ